MTKTLSPLYDPRFEHDSCGVSFVVDVKGRASHRILSMGIGALCNMEHRGATGTEPDTGDGAGVMLQIPDRFLRQAVSFELPKVGEYGVGITVLPRDPGVRARSIQSLERIAAEEGLSVLGWRDLPTDDSTIGTSARRVMPHFAQLFLADPLGSHGLELERKLFIARKRIEHELSGDQAVYFPSLSCRTIVYKGMLTTPQLAEFFCDLVDERMETALALVHSRFSTNTFPNWRLAQPFRYLSHNGEINTIRGNLNKMKSKEALMKSSLFTPEELAKLMHELG